ncbi:hypothetical protein [Maricaulis sp. CAU 1757]
MKSTLAIAALALLATGAAWGQAPSSVYTRIDENCAGRALGDEQPVYETACAGPSGWSVYLHASEHGQSIRYVADGQAWSTPVMAPQLGMFGEFHDVIEWRYRGDEVRASIHRYFHYSPGASGAGGEMAQRQTLQVTGLRAGVDDSACAVAWIAADRVANANELARRIADRIVPAAACPSKVLAIETLDDARRAGLSAD